MYVSRFASMARMSTRSVWILATEPPMFAVDPRLSAIDARMFAVGPRLTAIDAGMFAGGRPASC
jgi:hypothetical protein